MYIKKEIKEGRIVFNKEKKIIYIHHKLYEEMMDISMIKVAADTGTWIQRVTKKTMLKAHSLLCKVTRKNKNVELAKMKLLYEMDTAVKELSKEEHIGQAVFRVVKDHQIIRQGQADFDKFNLILN